MKAGALVASFLASACAHHPSRVAWSDIELGFRTCGARAQLEAVLDRACTLTVTANRTAPRTTTIAPADCRAVLSLAANRASRSQPPPCSVPQPFIAGVAITLDNGRTADACWNDALASQMAALAEKLAPDWRRGVQPPSSCDFDDDKIENDLVAPHPSR
jgi:hypothetical protein